MCASICAKVLEECGPDTLNCGLGSDDDNECSGHISGGSVLRSVSVLLMVLLALLVVY